MTTQLSDIDPTVIKRMITTIFMAIILNNMAFTLPKIGTVMTQSYWYLYSVHFM